MKIKIPFNQASKLIRDLIKALPGGITKEEGQQLAEDLVELGLAIAAQAIPAEMKTT